MMEEFEKPQENIIQKSTKLIGGGFDKTRRNELYFGKPVNGTYPSNRDVLHIHDVKMSNTNIRRFYGLSDGGKEKQVHNRLMTDSKDGLIRELVEETSMTRKEAEEFVRRYMERNGLVEVDDPGMGKIIVEEK